MLDGGLKCRLAPEALTESVIFAELGAQQFERHHAAQARLRAPVHDPHPATADHAVDGVRPDLRACAQHRAVTTIPPSRSPELGRQPVGDRAAVAAGARHPGGPGTPPLRVYRIRPPMTRVYVRRPKLNRFFAASSSLLVLAREQAMSSLRRSYKPMSEAWVYLLRCTDGSLYTGWTIDLERRL